VRVRCLSSTSDPGFWDVRVYKLFRLSLFIRRCVSVGVVSDAIRAGSSCECVSEASRSVGSNFSFRTPRSYSVCGVWCLSRRGDRRSVGARFGRWCEATFGRA